MSLWLHRFFSAPTRPALDPFLLNPCSGKRGRAILILSRKPASQPEMLLHPCRLSVGLPKQLTPGREVSPMRRFAILSVLVGLGIASLLPADWPVKKPPPPSAEQFILQLADR